MTVAEVIRKLSGAPAGTTSRLTLPVHRHDLDVDRRDIGFDRRAWIEVVSPDPGDAAEKPDGERRDRPDDHLDTSRELPVRQMDRLLIAGAEPPGEEQRQYDDRHDDREHDRCRVEQNGPLRRPDRALRIEHPGLPWPRDLHNMPLSNTKTSEEIGADPKFTTSRFRKPVGNS
jgi:hypothetical protein